MCTVPLKESQTAPIGGIAIGTLIHAHFAQKLYLWYTGSIANGYTMPKGGGKP